MKQDWTSDEIIEHFTLTSAEIAFLRSNDPHNQLGKAILLKFFELEGRFPEDQLEVSTIIIAYIAQQLDLPEQVINQYNWHGRRIKEHRKAIRELLGFRPVTLTDQEEMRDWLVQEVLPEEYRPIYLEELVYKQLRKLHVEPPSKGRMKRLVSSAIYHYEQIFFTQTVGQLSPEVKTRLHDLIDYPETLDNQFDTDAEEIADYPIHELKVGAGSAKVKNIKRVCARLKQLQSIDLPGDLFACRDTLTFSASVSATSGG